MKTLLQRLAPAPAPARPRASMTAPAVIPPSPITRPPYRPQIIEIPCQDPEPLDIFDPKLQALAAMALAAIMNESLGEFRAVDGYGYVIVADVVMPKRVDPRVAFFGADLGSYYRTQMRDIVDATVTAVEFAKGRRGWPSWYYANVTAAVDRVAREATRGGIPQNDVAFFVGWWGMAAATPFYVQPELARVKP